MELIQKNGMVYHSTRQDARRSHRTKKPDAIHTGQHDKDDFLKHQFFPVWENPDNRIKKYSQLERELFNSLSNLAGLYGFQLPEVSGKVFPLNIYLAYRHACNCLKAIDPKLHLLIIQDARHTACLATMKIFNTGNTLFYLPIYPLHELRQNKNQQPKYKLLLSVLAYLYQIVEIPYFTEKGTSMYYFYTIIKDWIDESPDEWGQESLQQLQDNFDLLFKEGEIIRREIARPEHLQQFEMRIRNLPVHNLKDKNLKNTIRKFWKLYVDYPNRSIFNTVRSDLIDCDEDQKINIDEYISFYWSCKDHVYDHLIEHINATLQERMLADEPATLQFFDHPQCQPVHDLSFEERLFELLHELADILNLDL